MIIQVKKLWQNGEMVALCDDYVGLNCDNFDLGSLKDAWIVFEGGCCGAPPQANLTFQAPDPSKYFIHGIWVQDEGAGILLDAATVDAVAVACNTCCGQPAVVAPVYNGVIPPSPVQNPNTYCITRSDNGSYLAVSNAFLDYTGKYQTMVHKSYAAGVSKYEITAVTPPVPVGADVVSNGACV